MKTETFVSMLKYSIASMFVIPSEKKGYYCPINLLLIAPPECGKTKLLKNFKCAQCKEIVDLSSKVLSNVVVPMLEKNELKFLIVPDMIQMLGHSQHVTQATIQFLNALIEEGVQSSMFYGQEFNLKQKVNCGLITGVTPDKFYQNFNKWNSIGFVSRMIPISFDYSSATKEKIHNEIADGELVEDFEKFHLFRKNPMKIYIPKSYGRKIKDISLIVADRLNTFYIERRVGNKYIKQGMNLKGFRLHERFRQLTRAICFIEGNQKRNSVNEDDIKILELITGIINLPNGQLIL